MRVTDGSQMIKVGDRVRVKPSVTTPQYKWGSINHHSVGTVTSLHVNGRDLVVEFPGQKQWTGVLYEMEIVPSVHTDMKCDGCKVNPITGPRSVVPRPRLSSVCSNTRAAFR